MTLDELVQQSVSQEKERRRYALLQAASAIYLGQRLEYRNAEDAIEKAEFLLERIEEREKENA